MPAPTTSWRSPANQARYPVLQEPSLKRSEENTARSAAHQQPPTKARPQATLAKRTASSLVDSPRASSKSYFALRKVIVVQKLLGLSASVYEPLTSTELTFA